MMERLILKRSGFMSFFETTAISVQNGCLETDHYLRPRSFDDELFLHYHDVWPGEKSRQWLEKLEQIHFENWQDKYWINACDGEQWELCYRLGGQQERIVFGSNAFPDDWDRFIGLISEIVHGLPRAEDSSPPELIKKTVSWLNQR